jgi:polysaccharide export outer membrane protein
MRRILPPVLAACATLTLWPTASLAQDKLVHSLPPPDQNGMAVSQQAYRIGPLDKLDISVFQVPELTGSVEVDAAGQITLPLIGQLDAGGKTTKELSQLIGDRLKVKYLQDPQVTVVIKEALSQRITIEGAVQQPGVYPIEGRTTLMQVVAMARGADPQRANEKKVVVFRTVNGQRMAAGFNLVDIRTGKTDDPQVYGNDIIVVDSSNARGFLRDLVSTIPLLAIFRPF